VPASSRPYSRDNVFYRNLQNEIRRENRVERNAVQSKASLRKVLRAPTDFYGKFVRHNAVKQKALDA